VSSYGQWASSRAKNGPARLTWVCGESRFLVHEVIGVTANAIGADDTEQWQAGRDRERDIWTAVMAIPVNGYKRLIIIRDSGQLRDWGQLRRYLDARKLGLMQGSYLLFEAEEHDFPKDGDGKLTAPADWLRDSTVSQIVRCSPLNPEDAAAWVLGQFPFAAPEQVRHLLHRASGDLGEVRAVLVKARLLLRKLPPGSMLTAETFDLLCAELPSDFTERLILRDLSGAMLAAEALHTDDVSRSLGYLASRLELLATLHRAARDNTPRRDIIVKLGVSGFLVQKYFAVASAEYMEQRVSKAWLALSAAEDAHRGGATDGVAEALVVSWWA
jgi:hypothetical protein